MTVSRGHMTDHGGGELCLEGPQVLRRGSPGRHSLMVRDNGGDGRPGGGGLVGSWRVLEGSHGGS